MGFNKMKLSEYKLLLKYTENDRKYFTHWSKKQIKSYLKDTYNSIYFYSYLSNYYKNQLIIDFAKSLYLDKFLDFIIKMIRDFKLKRSIKKFIKG